MDARELRIGNWVQTEMFGHKRYCQVSSVEIRDCEHYGDNWSFKPITLTPEILEKAGFIWSPFSATWFLNIDEELELTWHKNRFEKKISIDVVSPDYGENRTNSTQKYINCRYLHQLQNLYFALTQTELSINL